MTLTPQDFVSKWKRAEARERQSVQEHFIDLCQLAGHPTPIEADPSGMHYAFEMGAAKTSGGQGWADVAKLGYFGWEYKSKDADLEKAYDQLLRYRDSLQNPPLLIVSDTHKIIIRTNYTNLPTRTIILTLDDLLTAEGLKTLKAVFFNPEELKPQITVEGVTEEAAKQFSRLAGILRKYGEEPQAVAHFLIRLLFCLFAEDIGLLPERLFPRLLEQTKRRSKDFMEVLRQLFRAMNTGGYFGADKVLHFNGGLFDDDHVLELDGDAMEIIAKIDALDWAAIEPSIFGTLFERGLDPAKRSQLGAHYTSRADILLIVEPVLMAPLLDRWGALKEEVTRKKQEAGQESEKKRAVVTKEIGIRLRAFADEIAAVRVLDPACGSGNFLYVALRRLLDLQKEVINLSDELGAGRFFLSVSPTQLHGIETNEYAHELAQITIWIGYIQWLVDNGYGLPSEPILKSMDTILQMDAVLAYAPDGSPIEPEWPAVDIIIGNPPFLGDKKMRTELGNKYVEDLRDLYGDRIPGQSDLVCYWFEKAHAMIKNKYVKRAGLLATNSIRGGANRVVLENILQDCSIFMAWSDREWVLEGAAVNVSLIGFGKEYFGKPELDGKEAGRINADLTDSVDYTQAKKLKENSGLCFVGVQRNGPFELTEDVAEKMIKAVGNPNGSSNSDVIKPWMNALDITGTHRKMWIIDFGTDMTLESAAQYEIPFSYIEKYVKPARANLRRKNYVEKWWLFAEARPGLRRALSKLRRFIATPMVSKHRVFVWVPSNVIPENLVVVIAREDDYMFGVLHSKLHEIWVLQKGTSLEDRPRYSQATTFETFPFPWAPGKEPGDDPHVKAVAQAAKELVEQRDRWLNPEGLNEAEKKKRTLTNLYNARPTWLNLVHKKLDEAVFAAYGWKSDLSDEEILEKLLMLNLERTKIT